MYVDYTDIKKACPKDVYPLPSIDKLVDSTWGYLMSSFLDAYSGYNQNKIYPPDEGKTTFIFENVTFFYKVMPFGLKNVGATYQPLMDKILQGQLGKNLEVYMDNKVVKSDDMTTYLAYLEEAFG